MKLFHFISFGVLVVTGTQANAAVYVFKNHMKIPVGVSAKLDGVNDEYTDIKIVPVGGQVSITLIPAFGEISPPSFFGSSDIWRSSTPRVYCLTSSAIRIKYPHQIDITTVAVKFVDLVEYNTIMNVVRTTGKDNTGFGTYHNTYCGDLTLDIVADVNDKVSIVVNTGK